MGNNFYQNDLRQTPSEPYKIATNDNNHQKKRFLDKFRTRNKKVVTGEIQKFTLDNNFVNNNNVGEYNMANDNIGNAYEGIYNDQGKNEFEANNQRIGNLGNQCNGQGCFNCSRQQCAVCSRGYNSKHGCGNIDFTKFGNGSEALKNNEIQSCTNHYRNFNLITDAGLQPIFRNRFRDESPNRDYCTKSYSKTASKMVEQPLYSHLSNNIPGMKNLVYIGNDAESLYSGEGKILRAKFPPWASKQRNAAHNHNNCNNQQNNHNNSNEINNNSILFDRIQFSFNQFNIINIL